MGLLNINANIIGAKSGGSSASTVLYPSTDRAIRYGSGAKPYLSFGDGSIDPVSGRIYFIYVKQSTHNSQRDGDITFSYSDDGGATLSAEQTILSDPDGVGGVGLTSVCVGVTSTRRVIFFYSKQPVGTSIIYYKYSDDFGATLSSEFRFTTDFDPGYIDATGSCIDIGGILYKSCWTSNNAVLYTSVDNGANWVFESFISGAETSDECCMVYYGGTLYAFARNNGLHRILMYKSTNLGTTWGAYIDTGIPAQGKSPVDVTPDGVIFGLGREYVAAPFEFSSNRTILWQSNADRTSFSWQFIDNRTSSYMYGMARWNPVLNKGIAIWHLEAQNAGFGVRTILLSKDIIASTSSVAPPFAYNPWYQSMLDYSHVDGDAVPTPLGILDLAINTLIAAWDTDGDLITKDGLLIMGKNDAALSVFYLRHVPKAWLKATPIASPTYGLNGPDYNGSTQYVETNIIPSQQSNFLLNSGEFGWETTENVDEVKIACGCGNGSFASLNDSCFIEPRTSNAFFGAINNNGSFTFANTDSRGFYRVRRTASNAGSVLRNTVTVHSFTTVSTNRATTNFVIGGKRYAASTNLFCTWNSRIWYIGGLSSSNFELRWRTYLTTIGLTPNT